MALRIDSSQNRNLYVGTGTEVAVNDGNAIVTGNVGIGTTNPITKLHVSGSTGAASGIRQSRTGVRIWKQEIDSSGRLIWGYLSSESGSTTQTFTLDDNGNVGIGMTSPTDKLTVNGNLSIFENKIYNGSASNSAGVSFPNSTTRIDGYNGITFHSSTTTVGSQSERMRITNAGNVGIGTTAPLVKLQVYGNPMPATGDAASVEDIFTLYRNGSASVWSGGASLALGRYSAGNGSAPKSRLDFKLKNAAGSNTALPETTVMTMQSNGNVGIGTISPDSKLEVDGSFNVINGNNGITHFNYQDGSTNYVRGVTYFDDSSVYFTGGNIGIGTTGPLEPLSVFAGTNESVYDVLGVYNSITGTSAAGKGAAIRIGNDVNGNYSTKIATIYEDNNPSFLQPAMAFFTMRSTYLKGSEVERMRITSAGGISFGSTGTAYGTSGQVLTSAGNASPTWTTPTTGTVTGSGAATQVAFWAGATSLSGNNDLYWDNTNGCLGINDTTPTSRLKILSEPSDTSIFTVDIKHERNNADVGTHAMRINMDLSGADTTTADRLSSGLLIDIDSSANGDASNEHRIYGINSSVNFTGFTDLARGGYFLAESNYTGAKTEQLVGILGSAVHDVDDVAGGVSNMMGVYGTSSIQDKGDVDNAYGGFFNVVITDSRTETVGTTIGVQGEVEINKATALNYGTMIGVSSLIDNNETTFPNFGSQYLFKGDYQGTRGGSAYGVYCEGDKHYFEGSVGIGTTGPDTLLNVEGLKNTAILTLGSTTTDTSWVVGDKYGAINFYSADNSGAGSGVKASISYEVEEGTTGSTNSMVFRAAGTSAGENNLERMRITAAGNVGIGTTGPAKKLTVATDTVNDGVYITTSGGTNVARIGTSSTATSGALALLAGGSTKVFISAKANENSYFNGGGNVGIGVTGSNAKLEVSYTNTGIGAIVGNTTHNSQLQIYTAAAGKNSEIWFGDAGDADVGKIDYDHANDSMSFFIGATKRLSFDSAGTMLLGDTTTAYQTIFFDPTPSTVYGNGTLQIQPTTSPGSGVAQFTTNFADRVGGGTTKHNVRVGGTVTATNFIGGSGAYLPLSAGSSYPLTDTLYIQPTGSPTNTMLISARADDTYGNIQFTNAAETANWTELRSTSTQFTINNVNVGIGVTGPTAKLQVAGTTTYNSDSAQALRVCDATDVSKGIHIGFDTSVDAGIIQAGDFGVSYKNLSLNPNAGNVGIGTTAPDHTLMLEKDVNGEWEAFRLFNYHSDGSTVGSVAINMDVRASNGQIARASIKSRESTADSPYSELGFFTSNTTSTAPSERMTIDKDGNVGIGTTSPVNKLNVNGDIGYIGVIGQGSIYGNTGNNSYANIRLYDPATGYSTFNNQSYGYYLQTGGSTKLTILNNGNVGIGMTSPNDALEVAGNSATTHRIRINNANASGTETLAFVQDTTFKSWVEYNNSTGNFDVWQYTNNPLRFATNNTERIRITSAGTLLLKSGAFPTNQDAPFLYRIGGGSLAIGSATETGSGAHVALYTNSLERMRIDSSGNVGIGVTGPGNKLSVGGSVRVNDSGDGQLFFGTGNLNKIELDGTDMKLSSGGLAPTITMSNQGLIKFGLYGLSGQGTPANLLGVDGSGNVVKTNSFNLILDDTPAASTTSGSGNIVNWSVSETVTAGTLYAVKTNGGWTAADADSEQKSTYMLAIALGSNATAGMLLQGFFYKSSHGFTIGAPLYVSNTLGSFSNSRPTGSGDYVRIIGYATSTNYIYFDPDKTWVKIA